MRQGASGGPRWPAVLAWWLWTLTMLGLAVLPWLDRLLRQAGRPELTPLTSDAVALVLGVVSAATVGAVLASRRPRHPVGWLLLTLGLSLAAAGAATGVAALAALALVGHGRGGRAAAGCDRGDDAAHPGIDLARPRRARQGAVTMTGRSRATTWPEEVR